MAAEPWNTKCKKYFTPQDNSFIQSWKTKGRWFLNPPWGKEYTKETGLDLYDWLSKCIVEYGAHGNEGICLVPMNCETNWWQDNVKFVPYVFFPRGRIAYIDPKRDKASQPTKGTAIFIYVKELTSEQIQKLQSKGWLVQLVKIPIIINNRPKGGFKGAGVP